jgi:hypothetical protein
MAEDEDDIEIDGPKDVPPEEEEDEELEPASDEDGVEIFDTDSETMLSLAYRIATTLELSFIAFHVWESGL